MDMSSSSRHLSKHPRASKSINQLPTVAAASKGHDVFVHPPMMDLTLTDGSR